VRAVAARHLLIFPDRGSPTSIVEHDSLSGGRENRVSREENSVPRIETALNCLNPPPRSQNEFFNGLQWKDQASIDSPTFPTSRIPNRFMENTKFF
jgi:hypothetical protein